MVDETRRRLDNVVRLKLPAERWPTVGAALRWIDAAVQAGDADTLRRNLVELYRAAGVGDVPQIVHTP